MTEGRTTALPEQVTRLEAPRGKLTGESESDSVVAAGPPEDPGAMSSAAQPTPPLTPAGISPGASVRAFLLRFALVFAALEALVLLVLWRERWFEPYAAWNARLTAWLLGPFVEGARAVGAVLVSPTYSIHVRPGCDAYQASVVLLAGVVAIPAARGRKWLGAGLGLACLLALNPLRLAALLWTGVHHPEHFERMHFEILPALYVAAALALWLGWALWARRP